MFNIDTTAIPALFAVVVLVTLAGLVLAGLGIGYEVQRRRRVRRPLRKFAGPPLGTFADTR